MGYTEKTLQSIFVVALQAKKSTPIVLPYGSPFYLIAYGSHRCQRVRYHEVTSEYLQFDDEDQDNSNAHSLISPFGPSEDLFNNRIYYCYYRPIPCDISSDITCPRQTPSLMEMQHKDETIAKDEILSEEGREIVTVKATRGSKFVTGGGVGMMLMGSASVAVFARRFLTRARASY